MILLVSPPKLIRPIYYEVDLRKSLPLPGIQQMLLYDCVHKRHMPHGLEISQLFYQIVVQ